MLVYEIQSLKHWHLIIQRLYIVYTEAGDGETDFYFISSFLLLKYT